MKIICSSSKTKINVFTSSPATFGKFLCGVLNSAETYEFAQDCASSDEIELVFHFKQSKQQQESESEDQQHQDRDLVRRNLDTATTSLHPSVDPLNIRLEFSSSSFSIFVNKSICSLQKYAQYSICGNVYLLPTPSSSTQDNNTLQPIDAANDLYQNNAQKIIKSVYKNRIKNKSSFTTTTTSNNNTLQSDGEPSPIDPSQQNNNNANHQNNQKQIWTEACEMTRLLYPMKGNGEVLLEPNGVLLGDVVVVGKCSKFFYFGVKNDEEVQERFAVIGWAPHCDLELDSIQDEQDFSVKKHAPRHSVSFEFLENGAPSSLPRPLHEISWIAGSSSSEIITAQVVTYRILLTKQDPRFTHFHQQELAYHTRNSGKTKNKVDENGTQVDDEQDEGQNTDWIQKFQLEDSHILSLTKNSSTSPSLITISSVKQTVHQLHKYITIQGKGRGGMSGILGQVGKQLLKRMCDPKYSFTFLDKRDLNKERRNLDSLFLSTLGSSLIAGGGVSNTPSSVRVLLNNNNNNHTEKTFHLQNSDETQQVEFKQQLHQYNDNNNNDNSDNNTKTNNNSKANIERARRILAAFANTRGGLLFVGVNDAGDLVGIADESSNNNSKSSNEEILPRSTGFIPGMITNSVSHVKLKFPQIIDIQQQKQDSIGTNQNKPTAALDWWKKKPTSATAVVTPSVVAQQQTSSSSIANTNISKAVHVMAVLRGAAPFYSTAGPAPPPVRGQASTLLLNVTCMAERLSKELNKLMTNNNNKTFEQHDDSRRREREDDEGGEN